MKLNYHFILSIITVSIILASVASCASFDPYETLGLKRGANVQDIRKAYKQKAKEWHPDKNKDELAETKFVEINKAYEILSDPARKKLFDLKGVVDDSLNRNSQPNDMFDDHPFFTQSREFKMHFKMHEMSYYYQQGITLKGYENSIFPRSKTQPYLVLVYSQWCVLCLHILPLWQRLVDDLPPIGINLATVNYEKEIELAQKLGGRRDQLPHVAFIIDSKILHFKEDQFSIVRVIEFVRSHFPRNLISMINNEVDADEFINGWKDNKIRILLFGKLGVVRLRYLSLAYKYRSHGLFGYVELNEESTQNFRERFGVPSNLDSMLLFQEEKDRPAARISMQDLPYTTLNDIINSNKWLQLPRLSSQKILEELCPPESSKARRVLCVILVTEDRKEDDEMRAQLRKFILESKISRDRVFFAYIYKEKQAEFLNALSKEGTFDLRSHLVIVWRQDIYRLSYTWLSQPFVVGVDHWNTSRKTLQASLTNILGSSQPLAYETVIKELVDEHMQNIFGRIYTRLLGFIDVIREHISRQELIAVLSVIGSVLFIAAVGYVMTYLVRLEEEAIQRKNEGIVKIPRTVSTELKLHELRSETYNGMIRLLKPGCRTIVLLLDNQSKDKLIPQFHKTAWPYRKNKSLMFGWMSVNRGLQWYSRLLNLAMKNLDDEDAPELTLDLNSIHAKNCIGTVIALNGHRRYFCIYHAKHPESNLSTNSSERMQSMALRFAGSNNTVDSSGAFMGFDDLSDDSDISDVEKGSKEPLDEKPLLNSPNASAPAEAALEGFAIWLDRLFEGSTQRYYINYWPEFGNH